MEQKEFSTPIPHPTPRMDPSSAAPWRLLGPGIWELLLNSSPTGETSALQYYEPGAKSITDEIITHTYIEEVCFLEGGLKDVTLDQEWGKGAYAYRLPGMKHGPYEASAIGVLQFVKCSPAK